MKTHNKTDSPTTTLNGRTCCVLDLPCCRPPEGISAADAQAEVLSSVIMDACPEVLKPLALKISKELLSHVDLVPKGLGKAIVEAYRPWMTGG